MSVGSWIARALSLGLVSCGLLVPIDDHELAPPGAAPLATGDRVVLASGQGGPRGIALSATHVYWVNTEAGEVVRVPKEGGAPQALIGAQLTPLDVAVDGGRVYWFNSGGRRDTLLRAMPLAGGTSVSMGDIDGTKFSRMTSDTVNLWVTTAESRLHKVPKVGAAYSTATAGGGLSAVASDGSSVYVAQGTSILSAPGGSSPILFASGTSQPVDIATDDVAVYWLTGDGRVLRLDKSAPGGTATVLAAGLAGCARLALFGSDVFVTAGGAGAQTGKVLRLPKSGGAPVVLAEALPEPFGIAVDATGVYWTNHGDGTISALRAK